MSVKSSILVFASQRLPALSSRVLASSGYSLDLDRFGPDAFRVWGARAARRQDAAWRPIVAEAIAGRPRDDVIALWACLDDLPARGVDSLLEVGCGGGYVSELIAHHAPSIAYRGIDLSESMVEIAREHYPNREFTAGSAYALPDADASVGAVLDGVALIHMSQWRDALAEYRRVARSAVVLHGLTLAETPTTRFAKYAYGQPSMELVFNRAELLEACTQLGLTLTSSHPSLEYDLSDVLGIESVCESWVLSV
jgi:SAM-dependent methyltransferase